MGSKFLSSGGGDLAALQDGNFALNVSSTILQTLTPSYPVKTSATKELVSGLIQVADCAFTPVVPADLAAYLLKSGGTMTGSIDMGSNNITSTGSTTAGTFAASSTTDSISSSTGSITTLGGIGVAKALHVGSTRPSASTTTGSIVTAGGIGCDESIYFGNSINGPTALILTGFMNSAGANLTGVLTMNANNITGTGDISGGTFAASSTTDSMSSSTGSITTLGGIGVAKALHVGSTRPSTSTTTGSIVAAGGIGCDESIYFGNTISGPTLTGTLGTSVNLNDIVSNTAGSTSGNIASFSGTTGKLVVDSGVLASSIVLGPASVTTGRIATYNGTTGKLLADGGSTISQLATVANPTFTGTVTTPSITFNSTSGIIGTTTNNSAAALSVGEFVTSTGTTVGLTTGVVSNITSISLTAGDWNVWGSVGYIPSSTSTALFGGISSTSGTLPLVSSGVRVSQVQTFPSGQAQAAFVGQARFSLSATTTIYLVLRVDFASTCSGDGYIGARRVR